MAFPHKLGRKLQRKCHLNWRVKVSVRNWAQQKKKQRIRSSKQPWTPPGQSAVRHEMVGHSGAAMSRFPVWCVLCKPRIWIPESVEMSWLCIKPRHDCHQSFCCTSPFQDSRQRRNESLGYQVLLGHNRGMFLHEQPASVIFLSLLQDFQGTLRTYHSPLFCVWGKHIRKPTPELTHLEKQDPGFSGKTSQLPTANLVNNFQGGEEIERWER